MSSLGEMVARIREDLDRGADYDTRIRRAIVDAIRFYRAKRLGFNLKRARAVLPPDNEIVSLPLDWVEADFLRLEKDDQRQPLEEVTYDWMEDEYRDDDIRGRPVYFAIQHRELRLAPTPDETYTLMMSFQFELQNISVSASNGETSPWLTECEELIRKHASSNVYIEYMSDPESIAKGKLLRSDCEERILPQLEASAAREQSSGKIRAWL